MLLWAMTYVHAEQVELPKKHDRFAGEIQYNPRNLNPSSENILTIELIPDLKDYAEGMIKTCVLWVATDDVYASCKTLEMLDAYYKKLTL